MRAYTQYTEGHAYRGWSVSRCASLGGLIMRLQVQMGELFGSLADLALEIYLRPLRALTSHAPCLIEKRQTVRCMGRGSTRTPCINCHRGKYLIVRQPSRGKAHRHGFFVPRYHFLGGDTYYPYRRRENSLSPQNKQSARCCAAHGIFLEPNDSANIVLYMMERSKWVHRGSLDWRGWSGRGTRKGKRRSRGSILLLIEKRIIFVLVYYIIGIWFIKIISFDDLETVLNLKCSWIQRRHITIGLYFLFNILFQFYQTTTKHYFNINCF